MACSRGTGGCAGLVLHIVLKPTIFNKYIITIDLSVFDIGAQVSRSAWIPAFAGMTVFR
jgi:hypothetical protein